MPTLNLDTSRNHYYEAPAKISEICRQFAFAGIAIIWIFRTELENEMSIPHELALPGVAITAFFILDFLQYLSKTIIWGVFTRHKERQIHEKNAENKFLAPSWFPKIPQFFFVTKLLAISVSYLLILLFFVSRTSLL